MMNPNREMRGIFKIYDEPKSPNEGVFKIQEEPESPDEGVCLRKMIYDASE